MKPVGTKFANKYLPTDKYVPDSKRQVIVLTRFDAYDDYDLGFYQDDTDSWHDARTDVKIFPNYWREIPKKNI